MRCVFLWIGVCSSPGRSRVLNRPRSERPRSPQVVHNHLEWLIEQLSSLSFVLFDFFARFCAKLDNFARFLNRCLITARWLSETALDLADFGAHLKFKIGCAHPRHLEISTFAFGADDSGRIELANVHLHVFLIFVVCGCVFIAAEVLRVRMEIEARVVLLKQDVFAGDSFAEMREGTPVAYSFLFAAINVSLIIAGCWAGIWGHLGTAIKSGWVSIVAVHELHDW